MFWKLFVRVFWTSTLYWRLPRVNSFYGIFLSVPSLILIEIRILYLSTCLQNIYYKYFSPSSLSVTVRVTLRSCSWWHCRHSCGGGWPLRQPGKGSMKWQEERRKHWEPRWEKKLHSYYININKIKLQIYLPEIMGVLLVELRMLSSERGHRALIKSSQVVGPVFF